MPPSAYSVHILNPAALHAIRVFKQHKVSTAMAIMIDDPATAEADAAPKPPVSIWADKYRGVSTQGECEGYKLILTSFKGHGRRP